MFYELRGSINDGFSRDVLPNCAPRLLIENVDGEFSGCVDRTKDCEKDERRGVWV
jgi:hypothetical protein